MNVLAHAAGHAEIAAIVEALRQLAGQGEAIPAERVLARQLNVKRHRLRQALDLLRGSGELAAPRPRRPAIRPRHGESLIRATNPLEVIELRLIIEPSLARLAALRASPLEIARIRQAASTPPAADHGAADRAFHHAVAIGARNGLAVEVFGLLRQVGTDARVRIGANKPACPKRLVERDTEHHAIATAIEAREPDLAEQAMRVHLGAVQRRIVERLTPGLLTA